MDVSTVTVGDTPTLVANQGGHIAAMPVRIQNIGGQTVYFGPADVDTTSGYEVAAGDELPFTLFTGDKLYGIVASGSCDVKVISTLAEGGYPVTRAPSLVHVLQQGHDAGEFLISNMADPVDDQDAATKLYVDDAQAAAEAAATADASAAAASIAGKLKFAVVNGAGSNANLALPGIAAGDTIIYASGTSNASDTFALVIHANDVVRCVTDTTGDKLLVLWFDLDG